MPILQYGQTTIEWGFQPDAKLKRHYVTVERGRPVLLRGPQVSKAEQEALVRRRARWIREKQELVNQPLRNDAIVTGSRLRYSGRTYFTEVRHTPGITRPRLTFTASRFIVEHPDGSSIPPEAIAPLLEGFYRERAHEKLLQRVRHWEQQTGLQSSGARIRHFESRWASCSGNNVLEFHPRVMELATTVQDYVIVHELCHTVEKNHTKAFWSLLAQHYPDWRQRHTTLEQAVFGDAV
ncbi:M48 family metallopeptidase [Paraburkholderia sp. USG1]|uniref:YgjP family zinc-dependent metalloprotease n=1 Tax=Paraburkholderia sp. USG1 TaxID=2952268 RepID=UPI00286628E2|nr:SprT family zinc-dependent metalloprotease [Paraburkholderia sp. USG1]MDR8402301.1 M48 family metallopeptidase [Paraburkholderia sp. USG1]